MPRTRDDYGENRRPERWACQSMPTRFVKSLPAARRRATDTIEVFPEANLDTGTRPADSSFTAYATSQVPTMPSTP